MKFLLLSTIIYGSLAFSTGQVVDQVLQEAHQTQSDLLDLLQFMILKENNVPLRSVPQRKLSSEMAQLSKSLEPVINQMMTQLTQELVEQVKTSPPKTSVTQAWVEKQLESFVKNHPSYQTQLEPIVTKWSQTHLNPWAHRYVNASVSGEAILREASCQLGQSDSHLRKRADVIELTDIGNEPDVEAPPVPVPQPDPSSGDPSSSEPQNEIVFEESDDFLDIVLDNGESPAPHGQKSTKEIQDVDILPGRDTILTRKKVLGRYKDQVKVIENPDGEINLGTTGQDASISSLVELTKFEKFQDRLIRFRQRISSAEFRQSFCLMVSLAFQLSILGALVALFSWIVYLVIDVILQTN